MNLPHTQFPLWFLPVGTSLQNVALSLIIGGMLILGAFVAPVVFRNVVEPAAGDIMSPIFKRYDSLLLVCVCLLLVGEALRVLILGCPCIELGRETVRLIVWAALVGLILYSVYGVNAQIYTMHQAGTHVDPEHLAQFSKVHKLSEQLFKTECFLGLILLVLNAL